MYIICTFLVKFRENKFNKKTYIMYIRYEGRYILCNFLVIGSLGKTVFSTNLPDGAKAPVIPRLKSRKSILRSNEVVSLASGVL
jgi:hypothetical protein